MPRNSIPLSLPASWKIKGLTAFSSIKHLNWAERCILVNDFHDHMLTIEGKPFGFQHKGGWNVRLTAVSLKVSKQTVVIYRLMAKALIRFPELANISSLRKAMLYAKNNNLWGENYQGYW